MKRRLEDGASFGKSKFGPEASNFELASGSAIVEQEELLQRAGNNYKGCNKCQRPPF
jgi:hypothetical protein